MAATGSISDENHVRDDGNFLEKQPLRRPPQRRLRLSPPANDVELWQPFGVVHRGPGASMLPRWRLGLPGGLARESEHVDDKQIAVVLPGCASTIISTRCRLSSPRLVFYERRHCNRQRLHSCGLVDEPLHTSASGMLAAPCDAAPREAPGGSSLVNRLQRSFLARSVVQRLERLAIAAPWRIGRHTAE